jgi:hypothetical protein
MPPDPRRAAQARANQIRAFRRELDALAGEDITPLTPEQDAVVRAHHDRLLASLARDHDIDRSDRAGQLSRGLRIASVLGAAALVAAVTTLVERVWGSLTLPAQVTLLTAFPMAALAGVHVAAERERTRYVAGLFALVACGTAWFAIGMAARLLDLPASELLLWPAAAFGFAVAASYGFRLVFALATALLIVAAASGFFGAAGVPWTVVFERLEPLVATAFVVVVLSRQVAAMGDGFDAAARLAAIMLGLGGLLVQSNVEGTSLLAFRAATSEAIYQVLFVPVSIWLLWRALRTEDTAEGTLVASMLALFLLIRYTDWFWGALPAWAFFLVLAGVAFGSIAVLRKVRRREERA